eukprot:m.55299 g.55299  ORF g.55299 m.55299 type:complete len:1330 (+) comp15539_c0_seq7:165-4154(+)
MPTVQKALTLLSHATARKFGRSSVVLSSAAVAVTCTYLAFKAKQQAGKDAEGSGKGEHNNRITYFTFAGDFLDKIKIVDVVRYISGLCRDLLDPERLKADPRNYVKRLLSIVWPSFSGPSSADTEGRMQIMLLLVIGVLRTWLMNHTANLTERFTRAVYNSGTNRLRGLYVEAGVLIFAGSVMMSVREYANVTLANVFRKRLTDRVHETYFKGMNYYHMANLPGKTAIGDADQRIGTEIISVSNRLTSLVFLLTKSVPPFFWFTYTLWRRAGWHIAVVPHLYLLLAYEVAQRLFPKNIGDKYRKKAASESNFTLGAARMQTHAEAIVALHGASREKTILDGLFEKVHAATKDLHNSTSTFGLIFKVAYTYGCRSWLSIFVMLPALYDRSKNSMSIRYAATQSTWQVMLEMLVANGNMLTLHATAQHMIGTSYRVCKLIDTLEDLDRDQATHISNTMKEGDCIAFEDVEIQTPTKNVLVKDLSFKLNVSDSLLLTGHNGAGKSSIFRVLGGLWSTPCGTITKPGASTAGLHQTIFYLPQKPYNVLGSLKANVAYPADETRNLDDVLPDARLRELLTLVDLKHLLDHNTTAPDDEDTLTNWENKLSLGEQQRLAMARLFFHCPRYAILDECTSAVSTEMENLLYSECQRQGITYITICHRPALRVWHKLSLNLLGDGNGGYTFGAIQHTDNETEAIEAQLAETQRYRDDVASAIPTAASGAQGDTYDSCLRARSAKYAQNSKGNVQPRSLPAKKPVHGAGNVLRLLRIMLPGSHKMLGALLVSILLRTAAHETYAYAVGELFGASMAGNGRRFAGFCLVNLVTDFVTALIEEAVIYLQNAVGTQWHTQLARHCIDRIMQGNVFYALRNCDGRVTDAEQRISEEVKTTAESFAGIIGRIVMPTLDAVWFSSSLYKLMGMRGMYYLLSYSALSAATIKLFLPDHEALDRREKSLEAAFKFVHNRLRNHAESVAFFGGDDTEHAIARERFSLLLKQSNQKHRADAVFGVVDKCVNKDFENYSNAMSASDVITFALQCDYVDVRRKTEAESTLASEGFYLNSSVNRAFRAFGKLSNIYTDISRLLGSTSRICELLDVMDEVDRNTSGPPAASRDASEPQAVECIDVDDVDIVTPNGVCLAKDVSLQVAPGNSLMVTGPNSTGKTSFFRVLAGLWPTPKGHVTIPSGGMQLVPQKAYSVTGSLGDQVTYPQYITPAARTEKDEARMLAALTQVGVPYLVDREGGWDTTKRWEDTLSLGEQQRIGLARLLFHKPAFAVLDECTDAVSVDAEKQLYESLHNNAVTCITISKRLALEEFHTKNFVLGVASLQGWTLEDI